MIPGMVIEHPQEIPSGKSQIVVPPEHPSGRLQQRTRRRYQEPRPGPGTTATAAKAPTDTPTKKPKGFDALPAATKKMILFATERDEHGRTATKPTGELSSMLELPNVSHI